MTALQMFERVDSIVALQEDNYWYLGIRFEDKPRSIGEVIQDLSRSNPDREDNRDFPVYGSDEYEDMDVLPGICAYNLAGSGHRGWRPDNTFTRPEDISDVSHSYLAKHCYILGSKRVDYGEDDNEIIMEDAVVLDVIF